MLVGLSWCTLKPTRQAFTWFGIASLPFFWFNYWAWARPGMFTRLIWLDFIGNIIWLSASVHGARLLSFD